MRIFFCLLLLAGILSVKGQAGTISGKVLTTSGNPIAGATITITGTTFSTQSGTTGSFALTLPSGKRSLTVSYVGYTTRQIPIIGTTSITITLEPNATDLDDVVVQAYGTTTRRLNTGSIGRVTAADIEKQPVTNPLAALQGRVPGVLITQSTGIPGSEIRIEIRGRSSLDLSLSRNDPLYIIDGVPFEPGNVNSNQLRSAAVSARTSSDGGLSPLNAINPSDIESIEVLKDADATAIYGSRGANGVILITTKKGKPGKTRFTLNTSFGASRVTRLPRLLSLPDYLTMRREAYRNDGITPTVNNAPDLFVWDTTRSSDLQQVLIGHSAFSSFTQASLSGGSATTQFSVAGGYNRQTNVFSASLSDQVRSARFTLNHASPDKKLSVQFSGIYSSDRNSLITTDLTSFTDLPPNLKLYDSLGKPAWSDGGINYATLNFTNPIATLLQSYLSVSDNLSTNLNLSYQVLPGLTLRASTGYNTFSTSETIRRPKASIAPTVSNLASADFGGSTSKSYILEPQAEYRRTIAKGNLSILAGMTFQSRSVTSYTLSGSNYTNDLLLGSIAAAGRVTATNTAYDYRYSALFGRINYAFAGNTYILNLTGRKDASSRFGPGKQTALFGAAGGAWLFSNYAAIKQSLRFLSFGKLRASYGITGNDQIGNYKYLDLWNPSLNPYQGIPGFIPASLFNPDYSWEINRKLEGAIELGFWKDRLQLSAAYFRNRSSNQIVNYTLPVTTGFDNVGRNLPALVQNTGLELLVSGKLLRTRSFDWSASFNLTMPRYRLISFPGLATSPYAFQYEEGQSLNLVRGYAYTGVDPQTGVYQFQDVNKDGNINNSDYLTLGNLDPKVFGGLQNTFAFKGLELGVFFEFRKQTGRTYFAQLSSNSPGATPLNQPYLALQRWQRDGDIAPVQRFATNFNSIAFTGLTRLSTSDGVLGDASYIRCKNISLSYALPFERLRHLHLESVRLFFHAQNLFVLTRYQGTDPETQDYYKLPPLRTLVGGIQITL